MQRKITEKLTLGGEVQIHREIAALPEIAADAVPAGKRPGEHDDASLRKRKKEGPHLSAARV